jgi:hypothetical protein
VASRFGRLDNERALPGWVPEGVAAAAKGAAGSRRFNEALRTVGGRALLPGGCCCLLLAATCCWLVLGAQRLPSCCPCFGAAPTGHIHSLPWPLLSHAQVQQQQLGSRAHHRVHVSADSRHHDRIGGRRLAA